MADAYKVEVARRPDGSPGALGVLKDVAEYKDENGEVVSVERQSVTYYTDEVVPADEIAAVVREALEGQDESDPVYAHLRDKLVPTSDGPTQDQLGRAGVPVDGYDDLDESEVLELLRVLPSRAVQSVKEYEGQNAGRESIVLYNAGLREGFGERGQGGLSAERGDADVKPLSEVQTREVGESSVEPGSGTTGSDPARLKTKGDAADDGSSDGKPARRRGRKAADDDGSE